MEDPQSLPSPQPTPPPNTTDFPLNASEERTWTILAHLSGIFLGFVGPLVIWLIFKDRSSFVNQQGKEALNFQITVMIGFFISGILTLLLVGILLIFIVWIGSIILAVLAALQASQNQPYRYPLTLRIIS